MANVESLNRTLGKFIMTYLTNKGHNDWTELLDKLRTGLNDIRKVRKDENLETYTPKMINLEHDPKYKVNDLVYRRLEKPLDETGQKYHNSKFRQGDMRFELVPRKSCCLL